MPTDAIDPTAGRPRLLATLGARMRAVAEPDTARSDACLNCGTPLAGPFCSACGQRDVPPYPTVRELAVDAFWELSGWDGRFASTVRALVRHPGKLTREFLEGRRARYISPLRLYLMASLVYFVVAVATPDGRIQTGTRGFLKFGADTHAGATASRPSRVAEAAGESMSGERQLTAEERAQALRDASRAPAVMRPFLVRAISDPAGFRRGLLETMPRMLFALLPVFAAIVALFYRGRRYPEHLYFAIHLHAFVFLALALAKVVQFSHVLWLEVIASLLALASLPVYATKAFRRVYGGSLSMTLVKEAGIVAIYAMTALVAFVLTLYWVGVVG